MEFKQGLSRASEGMSRQGTEVHSDEPGALLCVWIDCINVDIYLHDAVPRLYYASFLFGSHTFERI